MINDQLCCEIGAPGLDTNIRETILKHYNNISYAYPIPTLHRGDLHLYTNMKDQLYKRDNFLFTVLIQHRTLVLFM